MSAPLLHLASVVDGFWEEWMAWGACSLTCGRGSQSRQRECNMPKFSGKNCTGHSIERRTCKNRECPGTNRGLVAFLFLGKFVYANSSLECTVSCVTFFSLLPVIYFLCFF